MKETKKKEKHSRLKSIQHSSMARIASWTGLFNLHLDRCSRIFPSDIKGHGQDEVVANRRPLGLNLRTGPGRTFIRSFRSFHLVKSLRYRVNDFPSFHFRPEIFCVRPNDILSAEIDVLNVY